MTLRSMAFAAACAAALAAGPARAQEVSFAGKTVKVMPGVGPGGSNSMYAEAVARHMSRFLPGAPQIVVQHMPGANGLIAANYMATKGARDGTEFTITNRTTALEPLLGNRNALFDPMQLTWLGSANVENTTCIASSKARVKTFADLFETEIITGGTGPDSMEVLYPRVLNRMLGTKYKVVHGYPGSPQVLLAMEKGEVEGFCGIGWTYLKLRKADWVQEKKFNILFQMMLEKHPDLPETPRVRDFARDDEQRQVLDFLSAPLGMGRPFFAPPLAPAVAATLREAFLRTLHDAAFLADAGKSGLEIQAVSGEDVRGLVEKIYATAPRVVERARALLAD